MAAYLSMGSGKAVVGSPVTRRKEQQAVIIDIGGVCLN
jgi:hypothetical protein